MDPTKLPPTRNKPESPTGVYFSLHATDGIHRIACPYGPALAGADARTWLDRQPGAIKIQVWAGPPENPRAHLLATYHARANTWTCPNCGNDCAGECQSNQRHL